MIRNSFRNIYVIYFECKGFTFTEVDNTLNIRLQNSRSNEYKYLCINDLI